MRTKAPPLAKRIDSALVAGCSTGTRPTRLWKGAAAIGRREFCSAAHSPAVCILCHATWGGAEHSLPVDFSRRKVLELSPFITRETMDSSPACVSLAPPSSRPFRSEASTRPLPSARTHTHTTHRLGIPSLLRPHIHQRFLIAGSSTSLTHARSSPIPRLILMPAGLHCKRARGEGGGAAPCGSRQNAHRPR